jgi:hypothetical protein
MLPILRAFALAMLGTAACSSTPAPQPTTAATAKTPSKTTSATTKITAFSVTNENLMVDKVGTHGTKPDGNRDLAFSATIEGPFEALFIASVNQKGDPSYGLRADTLSGNEEIPVELGGLIDTGRMTTAIGVVEHDRFINGESGSAKAGEGIHVLRMYCSNSATLKPGSFVRLYVRTPAGELVGGPVAPY